MPTAVEFALAAMNVEGEARDVLLFAAKEQDLRERIVACRACDLRKTCRGPVPWEEKGRVAVAVIGEAPGADEDRQGRPFVGKAGQLLEELMGVAGFKRSDVALINTVCCRPPNNDFDLAVKADAPYRCSGFLREQIAISGAWVLVPVGARAFQALIPDSNMGITQARGRPMWRDHHLVFPTFHPAYALRNRDVRPKMVEDFQSVRGILLGVEHAPVPKGYDPSRLLSSMRKGPLVEVERKAFQAQWKKKGWVASYSPWLEDTVILVKDEMVDVPYQINGVKYTVKELMQLSHMDRNWEDARRLHHAKKVFDGTII